MRRSGGDLFFQILQPNDELSAVIGDEPMARGKIVKALNTYIIENDLRDVSDQRMVICDDKLKAIVGQNTLSMSKIVSHISKNTTSTNEYDQEMINEANRRKAKRAEKRDEVRVRKNNRVRKLLTQVAPEDRAGIVGDLDISEKNNSKIAELEAKVRELEIEAAEAADTREIGDPTLCIICASANRSYMFQPCNHIACCAKCANYVEMDTQECPICKTHVESIVKVFLA